jgi:glycosyltransferase involved in cell wall biosynthesis
MNSKLNAVKKNKLSIIIPTLNVGKTLLLTIQSIRKEIKFLTKEIIIVDGGSTDNSKEIAQKASCKVFDCERGRGRQLNFGGSQASGEWLLFLHADTSLEDNWEVEVLSFIQNNEKAAFFNYALDDFRQEARRIVNFR